MFNEENMPTTPGESYIGGSLASINATPTMTERLRRERATLQSRLAEVEGALVAIESHPEVQQVVDALTKLHWLR